jgi:hypothetical protein
MKFFNKIPHNAQIIKGLNGSSWFTIIKEKSMFRIERLSVNGELECSRLFTVTPEGFDINAVYEFTYISHCKECTIIQNNIMFKFHTDEY